VRKLIIYCILFTVPIILLTITFYKNLQPEQNNLSLNIYDNDSKPLSLTIAVIGDVHLPEDNNAIGDFQTLLNEVEMANPDLTVFVGDYISNPSSIQNITKHRTLIINSINKLNKIPKAVVLGNYESWSNADKWLEGFNKANVNVLENNIIILDTKKGKVCIRGLGDIYTNRYIYIDYPKKCKALPKITITHDPAGAFEDNIEGLVIAGHTHCGQINFPFIGPFWVPTKAPSTAHCGLYQDTKKTVFVTSGIGTSILPIRIGTQSQWDLLKVNFLR
jgi:predicted MPP superfamily phosphohydrolase